MISIKLNESNNENEFDFTSHVNFCRPILCKEADEQLSVVILTLYGYVKFTAGDIIHYGSTEYLINSKPFKFVRFLSKDEYVTFTGT